MPTTNKVFIITAMVICGHFICCNSAIGQISLSYEEFGIFFYPKKCKDTLEFTLTKHYPGNTLKLFLNDCGGECFIELRNKKKQLIMTGYYVNGPDTLQKYSFAKRVGPPFDKKYYSVLKIKYLSPLRSGTWTFYDNKGNQTDKFEYEYKFR